MKRRKGFLVKRGKTYFATWFINGKRFQQTTGKKNKKDADAKLEEIMRPFIAKDEAQVLRNIAASIEGKKAEQEELERRKKPPVAIASAWSIYQKSTRRPDSGPGTLSKYQGQFECFANWIKEHHPAKTLLRDVDHKTAESYAGYLVREKQLTSNTFNKHIRLLTLVFRVLHKEAEIVENPWIGVTRKKLTMNSRRELTKEELKLVCTSAAGEMRLLFAIGIYTGMRLGDCATLRWSETDLAKGVIKRVPNKTARFNSKPLVIPLHPVLMVMLQEESEQRNDEYVLPNYAKVYDDNPPKLVKDIQAHFETCNIRTIKPGTGYVVEIDKKGKTKRTYTGKRAVVEVGFHSLRHTFVILCREANAPLSVVESIVGHSNPAMTRHYTHTSEQAAKTAVSAIPFLAGVLPEIEAQPNDPFTNLCQKVRELASQLNEQNWQSIKAELSACTRLN